MAKGKVGLGRRGEALAAEALQQRGFTIVTQNWHCPEGEADLIAQRAGEWYFIEVRTRRGTGRSGAGGYGSPEESLTPRKFARMEAVARRYLSEQGADEAQNAAQNAAQDVTWHLSFVAVAIDGAGRLERITVYLDPESDPWEVL
jgi:Holliday junction resolvase-like predicted endonuclease